MKRATRPGAVGSTVDEEELFARALGELDFMSPVELEAAKSESSKPPPRRAPARLRRLVSRGEVEPVATLDLHGLDRHESLRRLKAFLRRHGGGEPRVVLVVHGKGTRTLADTVRRELDRNPLAAEHFPAPSRLGGDGARLVRLKAGS